MLQLQGIEKRFRTKQALRGINLDVKEGEVFVLLGPTGAGKTTTLRSIAGLEKINAGRIILAGRDVTDLHPMGRDIAMVFEGLNLIPVLSVRDNIAFALRSDYYRESESEITSRLKKITADLHIDHLLDRDVETLSGGEKQRVALARAMVRYPKLYLLDEPLSALDLKLREELRVELRQIHQAHGSTVLYATHDYHGAAAIADRVGIINEGKIYQSGPLTELFADPQHLVVGKLLGSPSMALFPARINDNRIELSGLDYQLRLSDLTTGIPPSISRLTMGIWPEDIEVRLTEQPGFQQATIYATDFRGMDRAVQVQTDDHSFRKVVGLDFPGKQGDPCWFGFSAQKVFLFDHPSGSRLATDSAK